VENLDESFAYASSQDPQSGVRITDQTTGEELTPQKRRRTAQDVMGTNVRVLYCTS
jgi:hypothetical protein